MSYEVLARKYRPSCFEEVIGQEHVVKALINSIESEKIHQAFIFSGTLRPPIPQTPSVG